MRITKYFILFIIVIVFTGITKADQVVEEERLQREPNPERVAELAALSQAERAQLRAELTERIAGLSRFQKLMEEASLRRLLDRCFIVDELKGYSVRDYKENFEPFDDGMSDTTIYLQFRRPGDKGGKVTAMYNGRTSGKLPCEVIGINTLVCIDKNNLPERTLIETWSVFPDENKAVLMKTDNGLSLFAGASFFVGEIRRKNQGTCKY